MKKVQDIAEDSIIFYDIETTSIYAPYCEMELASYQVGINSEPVLVRENNVEFFREMLADPNVMKISYNGINFDNIVLWRHGFYVHPRNRHDMYLALKTIRPNFPSFGLKFVNWYLNNTEQSLDKAWHEPEHQLEGWLYRHDRDKKTLYTAPGKKLADYCKHDVRETVNVFRAIWEKVQEPLHWKPYCKLELAMGEPLHEMILIGKEHICTEEIVKQIREETIEREKWIDRAKRISNGEVRNVCSSKQTNTYLEKLGLKLPKSEAGNSLLRKMDKLDIINSYIEGEEEDDDLSLFNRLSSSNPQNTRKEGPGDPRMLDQVFEKEEDSLRWEQMFDLALMALAELNNKKRIILILKCSYEASDATKVIGYLRSYLEAGRYERERNSSERKNSLFHPSSFAVLLQKRRFRDGSNNKGSNNQVVTIPKSYYLSGARTRRFQSSSQFGINFQNQNKRSKVVQLVPEGWLGFWLDSTQIENVVHIYESHDEEREAAYRLDEHWNEYVWLCNAILGKKRNREQLDKIDSKVNPSWSIYKQYKTIKLALNFGMGTAKFARTTGLDKSAANRLFEEVHAACSAIRKLQRIVKNKIRDEGYVRDAFGHIYTGQIEEAYKIVAYLIQGCGTGSVPKAMTIANYKTLHSLDSPEPEFLPCIYDPHRKLYQYGVLTGTTHDECAGRISLGLPTDLIIKWLEEMLENMEGKFSYLFRGIPLRAKLAVSITNAAEQEEIDHHKEGFREVLRRYIYEGRKANITKHRS